MSGFFGRLSGKKDTHTPPKASAASSESSASNAGSHDHVDVAPEDLDLGSASERGDEPELPDDESASKSVTYGSLHQSLLAQRQGLLPALSHRPWGAYTEDDLKGTMIRGATYLSDSVKVPCGPALYTLAHVDIFYTRKEEARVLTVLGRPESFLRSSAHKQWAAAQAWSSDPAAASLVLNFTFPGPKSTNMNLSLFFHRRVPPTAALPSPLSSDETLVGVDPARVRAYDNVLRRFRQGSDAYRDGKLKIIPRVAEGGYIVRKSIGRVPALLGKKLKSTYTIDDSLNAMEITADVGSSKIAGRIINLIKKTARSLVVDMTFLFQGDSGDELPESIIGGVRISHCDIDAIQHITDNDRVNGFKP